MTTKVDRLASVTINLSALDNNVQQVKTLCKSAKLLAVIKSDAYGHGLLAIATRLNNQVDGLAVATVSEAIQLRHYKITKPIIVLQGFNCVEQLMLCVKYNLTPIVHDFSQIDVIKKRPKLKINIWLKFDTGMGRLGFMLEQQHEASAMLSQFSNVNIECIASHLSDADILDSDKNLAQQKLFEEINQFKACSRSLLNSAGLLNTQLKNYDWVRVGLLLYGVNPLKKGGKLALSIKPVMELKAPIIAIKTIKKGMSIGYGSTVTLTKDTNVAVVALGYGDGFIRACNNLNGLLNTKKVNILGRISMDSLVVDVSGVKAKINDQIIFWGDSNPIEQVANKADTISYELLCLASSIKHKYIN